MSTKISAEDGIMLIDEIRAKKDAATDLQLPVRHVAYERIRSLRGKIAWTDADESSLHIPTTQMVQANVLPSIA